MNEINPESRLVVMGVCGCGKSTIGKLLAKRLRIAFLDADDFHPLANINKMARGKPLDDHDRQPWLEKLNRLLIEHQDGCVLACSALKKKYRDTLSRQLGGRVVYVHLEVDRETTLQRVGQRDSHFMPVELVDSQFAALEPPHDGIAVDGSLSPDEILDAILGK